MKMSSNQEKEQEREDKYNASKEPNYKDRDS
jgi:hypothetical protein